MQSNLSTSGPTQPGQALSEQIRIPVTPIGSGEGSGQVDVAVVGGGLAGLAAAATAARAGRSVVLFEGAPTLGGRARTRTDQTGS